MTFETELRQLLNRYSKENDSNTPDYILAFYLGDCLNAYARALKARDKWFDYDPWHGRGKMTLEQPETQTVGQEQK